MDDETWAAFRLVIVVFHIVAILTTCFRLFHRFRVRRLWWDDFWALVSLLSTIIALAAFLAFPFKRDFFKKSLKALTVGYWLTLLPYTCALWTARMSVAVTIVRLFNQGPARRCAKGVCIFFGLVWAAVVVQKFTNCGKFSMLSWNCRMSAVTAYLELSTDIVADLWLLGSPMYMLWKVTLSSRRYRRLKRSVFACNILVTVPSVIHSVYIIRNNITAIGISGQFQVSASLTICNLLVVVSYLYRAFHRNESEEAESSNKSTTAPPPRTSVGAAQPHSNNMPSEISSAPLTLTEISTAVFSDSIPASTFRLERSNIAHARSL